MRLLPLLPPPAPRNCRAPSAAKHCCEPTSSSTSGSGLHNADEDLTRSSGPLRHAPAGSSLAMPAAALLLPLVFPDAAAAAAAGHSPSCTTMYWACVGLGTVGVLTTLLFTSRFLMS